MLDLSKELTVFIITVSDDVNYNECIKALQNQTVKFKLEIIKDYAPLSKAFQEMLNRCTTKYYIEVDSDMILNPDAVEKLYHKIIREANKCPIWCYKLLDVHLNFQIYGVKIYNFEVFKNYPYNLQHPSCEVEQLARMKKDGYNIENICINEVIGKHSPNWTDETIFERYYNLMEKFKLFRYVWLEKLPKMLMDIYQKNPTSLNFYAIAGMLSSIYSDKVMEEEKNVNIKRKDLMRIKMFLEKPTQATLYMTPECNFNCQFCWRQHNPIEENKEATAKTVHDLLAKFPTINGVCICGFGEPLMSSQLVPVLQALKSANEFVGLITNGSLLKRRLPELIGWHQPDYISVSLNSHNKEFHKKTTGTDTWEIVLDGIRALVASPIKAYVSSVVTADSLPYVDQFLQVCKSLGIETVHLHNLLPHQAEKDDDWFWGQVLTVDHKPFIDELKKLPEASIVKLWPTLIDKEGGKQNCKFPWKTMAINGAGSLSICNSVFPCSNEMFGNINDFNTWNSAKLEKFRDDFVNKRIEACKKCFRNWNWDNCQCTE